ncbi:MAG TPA: PKD domain-containing protein [Ohtaekwangia sp.]|uniref:PKD domain-containing protein n=1 Tax=Ohtaekwangia sp. TaxID=2066019 RepID=UPI002F95C5D6
MKKLLYNILWILCIQVLLFACKEDDAELGSVPTETDAAFTYAPTAAKPNILDFTASSAAFLKKWDFGNGKTAEGDNVQGVFPEKGSYVVTLTVYTSGGSVSSSQTVEIAETDPTLLDLPIYNMLTGGNSDLDGKTWVVDSKTAGHFGLGPVEGTGPDWYKAGANEKDGAGLYDDKYTFKLAGFSYTQQTNGDVFINTQQASNFPGAQPSSGDYKAPYTPPANLTWSITETGGKQYLKISSGGFIGYYTGVNTYEIVTIEENQLFLRYTDAANAAFAWYLRLVPDGYTEPTEPPPYKIEDIYQNFDGSSNFNFVNDSQGSMATYDNPAPVPINTSAKVGKYTKANGQAGEYANVQIPLSYKMDIRNRHVFKLKVFIPSYNDYTTTGGESWQSYNTLQKQVSVKLQNSELGGNAYTTQAEVIQKNLVTDKWLELTFDFSAFSTREDFDKVIVQIGGEAIFTGGIFFIDDFELLPE